MIINKTNCPKIKVKNSHRDHKETGWLNRWKKARHMEKEKELDCSNLYCSNKAEDGGHVTKVNSSDEREYIVPLCKSCNNPNNTEQYSVYADLLEYAQDLK